MTLLEEDKNLQEVSLKSFTSALAGISIAATSACSTMHRNISPEQKISHAQLLPALSRDQLVQKLQKIKVGNIKELEDLNDVSVMPHMRQFAKKIAIESLNLKLKEYTSPEYLTHLFTTACFKEFHGYNDQTIKEFLEKYNSNLQNSLNNVSIAFTKNEKFQAAYDPTENTLLINNDYLESLNEKNFKSLMVHESGHLFRDILDKMGAVVQGHEHIGLDKRELENTIDNHKEYTSRATEAVQYRDSFLEAVGLDINTLRRIGPVNSKNQIMKALSRIGLSISPYNSKLYKIIVDVPSSLIIDPENPKNINYLSYVLEKQIQKNLSVDSHEATDIFRAMFPYTPEKSFIRINKNYYFIIDLDKMTEGFVQLVQRDVNQKGVPV